jgi:hypothetical protein
VSRVFRSGGVWWLAFEGEPNWRYSPRYFQASGLRRHSQSRIPAGPWLSPRPLTVVKSREEQLTWAKQRALSCVDMRHFSDAVAGLRADLDANPLTKGVVSSDQARRGYKATIDAALGRGSQALTEWIEGFR